MTAEIRLQNPAVGIGFILIGTVAISVNDMLIKLLSGGYPLHQMVFTRSVIGIIFSLMLVQLEGGWRILLTKTPGLHLLRCATLVIANLTFFTALAVLTLAEATAIFFIGPLLITLLSIPVLGEKVGPLRLGAVVVGFIGVLIMTRPWQSGETREVSLLIYLLPIVAAFAYAITQVLTRKLGTTTKASVLSTYLQALFIVVSLGFWVVAGDGRYAEALESESLVFLLRAWVWPEGSDLYLFLGLGLNTAIVGYALAQAYRQADAATIAPFEYLGLPLAVFWGWSLWGELPDAVVSLGILLVLGSGLFVFLRERQKKLRGAPHRQGGRGY
ncbi:DMT family transporter [Roseovarius aestuarii]|uniref:Riboflavin transporter n=1 Tax=Roseovarius aestuarii TaxID=475083 RepID=A0A1X7BN18_9RHOB|nr:DMT family transporter [Roseovarius aestuarii]SMC11018.1 Riboflavin transporter [Roseovarius aestuarii]